MMGILSFRTCHDYATTSQKIDIWWVAGVTLPLRRVARLLNGGLRRLSPPRFAEGQAKIVELLRRMVGEHVRSKPGAFFLPMSAPMGRKPGGNFAASLLGNPRRPPELMLEGMRGTLRNAEMIPAVVQHG